MAPTLLENNKTTKLERHNSYLRRVNHTKLLAASSKLLFRATLLIALVLVFFFTINYPTTFSDNAAPAAHTKRFLSSVFYGAGADWETALEKERSRAGDTARQRAGRRQPHNQPSVAGGLSRPRALRV